MGEKQRNMDPDLHRGGGCEVPDTHWLEVALAYGVRAATKTGRGAEGPPLQPLGSTALLLQSLGFCLLDSKIVPVS